MTLAARAETLLARHWWRRERTVLALVLWPLAGLYGWLAGARRRRVRPQAAPVPVLVVGNIVAGGAGKTPTVVAIVQALQSLGRHPGVISRGHGRDGTEAREVAPADSPHAVGDEPLLILRRTGVPVWVGAQRLAAAHGLCAAHPQVDVLVSDDGLQHHALARQAQLLVFDERGIGNGLLLPAGPLREALPRGVGPATHVLYTGGAASTPLAGELAERRLGAAWPLADWHTGQARACLPLAALRGRPLLACAGLAAPEKFFVMLEQAGLSIQRLPLPDHHAYDTLPWPSSTPEVITTEKDAVKLKAALLGSTTVWVVPLDLQLPPGLAQSLNALLGPAPNTASTRP